MTGLALVFLMHPAENGDECLFSLYTNNAGMFPCIFFWVFKVEQSHNEELDSQCIFGRDACQ
jgi:hypothetical protein